MAFLPQGSSAQVAITAGESIAVGAVRGGTANVTFPVGYPKGPSSTVNNTTAVYGPFATATTVTVYAAQGTAEYVTGTSPVCTDGPVALATDPLTGGVLLIGSGGLVMPGSVLGRSGIASSITDSPAQSTTESTLQTLVIPANTLGVNDGIEISILYSCTNTAATKRIRGRFGGSVLWNLDLTTHLTFRQDFILRNRNSLSSQIAQAASTTIFSPIGSVGVQTFTLDFAAEQTLTLTGQFPVAGTSLNTLAIEQYSVTLI